MKFLIDENVDIRVVKGLRKEGYDIKNNSLVNFNVQNLLAKTPLPRILFFFLIIKSFFIFFMTKPLKNNAYNFNFISFNGVNNSPTIW